MLTAFGKMARTFSKRVTVTFLNILLDCGRISFADYCYKLHVLSHESHSVDTTSIVVVQKETTPNGMVVADRAATCRMRMCFLVKMHTNCPLSIVDIKFHCILKQILILENFLPRLFGCQKITRSVLLNKNRNNSITFLFRLQGGGSGGFKQSGSDPLPIGEWRHIFSSFYRVCICDEGRRS